MRRSPKISRTVRVLFGVEYVIWNNAGALNNSTAVWSQTMRILSALRYTN